MVQRPTDLEEHVGVDPGFSEDLVEVLAGAVHLASQPGNGTALSHQLILDALANMKGFRMMRRYRRGVGVGRVWCRHRRGFSDNRGAHIGKLVQTHAF